MRPCPVCGTLTEPTDEFCGNCGTYLGWNQQGPAESTVFLPRPVQPAVPQAPRPARETSVAEPKVDGPPCPNCGTPNPPGRRYCRKCAWPLTDAEPAAATVKPRRRSRWGGNGRLARTIVLIVLALALVAGGIALWPLGTRLVQDTLDKTSQPAPIHPVAETASGAAPGHPAADAVDGVTNHFWGAPGQDAWIDFTFDHPFRLLSMVITTGASTQPKEFAQQARPTQFDLVITAEDGTVTNRQAALADQPGPQTVQLGVSNVVRLRMVVRAVAGQQPGRVAALGEVEFFRRS